VATDVGNLLAALAQPTPHHRDLVALGDADPLGEELHVLPRGARRNEGRHLQGLRVVRNHALHEAHVG
jgi:hypothetical protein